MGSEWKKESSFSYRLLSVKQQKKLPGPLRDWLEGTKQNRGVHLRSYRGEGYLIIAAGMKPSPGYRLELVGVKKERGAPGLLIREVGPEPGPYASSGDHLPQFGDPPARLRSDGFPCRIRESIYQGDGENGS